MSNPPLTGLRGPQNVGTPVWLVRFLLATYPIRIDLAANAENAICPEFISPEMDSLSIDWSVLTSLREWGYCNPPYSDLKSTRERMGWAAKFRMEADRGARFLTLTPAALESRWYSESFHGAPCEVQIIRGRLRFPGYKHSAASAHMLTVWDGQPFRGPWPRDIKKEAKEIANYGKH